MGVASTQAIRAHERKGEHGRTRASVPRGRRAGPRPVLRAPNASPAVGSDSTNLPRGAALSQPEPRLVFAGLPVPPARAARALQSLPPAAGHLSIARAGVWAETAVTALSAIVPGLHCRAPLGHDWLLGGGSAVRVRCALLGLAPAPRSALPGAAHDVRRPSPRLCLLLPPAFPAVSPGALHGLRSALASSAAHSSGGGAPVTDLRVHRAHTAHSLPGCSFGPETPAVRVPTTLKSGPCTHRSGRDTWSP